MALNPLFMSAPANRLNISKLLSIETWLQSSETLILVKNILIPNKLHFLRRQKC